MTIAKVREKNPEIKTPLDSMPELDAIEGHLLSSYRLISRSRKDFLVAADISAALPIIQPDNPMEFAEDILRIESEI